MPLIIEDGTGVVDANSYVSTEEYKTYAIARGIAVPSDDEIDAALIKAMDYLEIKPCFAGYKIDDEQSLAFPRDAFTGIPKNLKIAQIRLAIAVIEGIELLPNISGNSIDYVIREKVGPIETEYASGSQFSGQATFVAVDALLAALIGDNCGNPFTFSVFRG